MLFPDRRGALALRPASKASTQLAEIAIGSSREIAPLSKVSERESLVTRTG